MGNGHIFFFFFCDKSIYLENACQGDFKIQEVAHSGVKIKKFPEGAYPVPFRTSRLRRSHFFFFPIFFFLDPRLFGVQLKSNLRIEETEIYVLLSTKAIKYKGRGLPSVS